MIKPVYKRYKRDFYLNNKNLLEEVEKSKKQNEMTKDFVIMLEMLTNRIAEKSNFASYTYLDEMKSVAKVNLVKQWSKFNPNRTTNAFAFYTQCIKTNFYQYLNYEKKQRNIKDKMLTIYGSKPSFTYTEGNNEEAYRDDSEEMTDDDTKISLPEHIKKEVLLPYKFENIKEIVEDEKNYHQYTISQGENTITGRVEGTYEYCMEYINNIVVNANIRQSNKNWMNRRW